jgi:hypothetical protein
MKLQNKILSGFAVLLVISIALTNSGATAEPSTNDVVKPAKLKVSDIVNGEGAIIADSGTLLKGHYRLALVETISENTDEEFFVKNGQFIIKGDGNRLKFTVDSNTWKFTESESGYVATGNVKDENGKIFHVSLEAQMVSEFNGGCIYTASGTLSDGITSYDLHYVSVMKEKGQHSHEAHSEGKLSDSLHKDPPSHDIHS